VRVRTQLLELRALARNHFTDLADIDFDRESSNVPLLLGNPPDSDRLRSLHTLDIDRDASTLVVRGGEWDSPPEGYGRR